MRAREPTSSIVALWHEGILVPLPEIERRILNHWITRGVPGNGFLDISEAFSSLSHLGI